MAGYFPGGLRHAQNAVETSALGRIDVAHLVDIGPVGATLGKQLHPGTEGHGRIGVELRLPVRPEIGRHRHRRFDPFLVHGHGLPLAVIHPVHLDADIEVEEPGPVHPSEVQRHRAVPGRRTALYRRFDQLRPRLIREGDVAERELVQLDAHRHFDPLPDAVIPGTVRRRDAHLNHRGLGAPLRQ